MGRRRGRGEGSIEQLPSGSWRAEIYLGSDTNGKPIRRRKTFKHKSDAIKWLAEIRVRHAAGEPVQSDSRTVGEWLTEWLAIHRPNVEPRTYAHDEFRVRRWLIPHLGTVKLTDLRGLHLSRMLSTMHAEQRSDSERQKAGAVLRKALNSAVAHGILKANPCELVTLPTPKREEKRAWTPEQCRAVIESADRLFGYGAIFRLWIECGFRPGEMFGLRWEDFAWESGTVRVVRNVEYGTQRIKEPKTRRSRRTLPVFRPTLEAVRTSRTLSKTEHVLAADNGKPFRHGNFGKWKLNPIFEAAGVPWSIAYTFRHTSATILLRSGIPIKTVSDRLGHEDITTTLRTYSHLIEGDSAHAADRIGTILLGVDEQKNTENHECKSSTELDSPAPATD